jgi:hypothetical protein
LCWIFRYRRSAFSRQSDPIRYTDHHVDRDGDHDSHASHPDRDGDQYVYTHLHSVRYGITDFDAHAFPACHTDSLLDSDNFSQRNDPTVMDRKPDTIDHCVCSHPDAFEYTRAYIRPLGSHSLI